MQSRHVLITYARRLLSHGAFSRSASLLIGSTALGQGVVLLASPALTRLYTPEDFGTFAVFVSLLGMMSVIATLRYELAIPLPKSDSDAAAAVILCLLVLPIVATILSVALWVWGDTIASWTGMRAIRPHLWMLPGGIVLIGLYQTLTYWAIRKGAYSHIAATKLRQGITMAAGQLGLFLLGPLGLIGGYLAGSAAGSWKLGRLAIRDSNSSFMQVSRMRIQRVAIDYRRFPQISTVSGLVNSGGWHLPALLLAALYGPAVAGQFALVQRIAGWPVNLLGQAVSQVYLGRGAASYRNQSPLKSIYLGTTLQLVIIAVLPVTALLAFGPSLFATAFGPEWHAAGTYVQLLAVMFAAQLVVSPTSQTLNLLGLQTWQLGWDLSRFVLICIGIGLPKHLGSNARTAIFAYGAIMIITYVALWFLGYLAITLAHHKDDQPSSNHD